MIRVSAGIIRREDGRILICQRGEGRHNAHLWEFPGGKQEEGETPRDCLRRELQEELRLAVTDVEVCCTREAEGIHFDFLTAKTSGEPALTEHEAFAFVQPRELLRYHFCPADTAVAEGLALSDPPIRHVLWDFDGTLMDTYPGMVKAFCRGAASMGAVVGGDRALTLLKASRGAEKIAPTGDAFILSLMKESLGYACEAIGREHGLVPEELLKAYRREEANLTAGDVQPLAGIPQALEKLRSAGCRHYVVTHRDHTAVTFLEQTGLKDFFADGVYREQGLPRKPAPDMLLYMMDKHGLDPARCIMIGDRPLDVQAGRAAGILTCLIDTENRFPDCPCDLRANTARGLAERLLAFSL